MTVERLDAISPSAVSRETLARLRLLSDLVSNEARHQNLVAASTLDALWERHIIDSLQLADHVPSWSTWIDLGTGAGFPGLVIAALQKGFVTMVELRRLRVDFLRRAIDELELDNAVVIHGDATICAASIHDVISARAFAPLPKLLSIGARFAGPRTLWVLPKGRNAQQELASVEQAWQGEFRLVSSITDPDASIIVARHVHPKEQA